MGQRGPAPTPSIIKERWGSYRPDRAPKNEATPNLATGEQLKAPECVLDAFCGSASTGVATLREGFSFIGIEQEQEYVEIARARLSAETERDAALIKDDAICHELFARA
jgi:site-specific DNA-methyltransferase (adenine-specific)